MIVLDYGNIQYSTWGEYAWERLRMDLIQNSLDFMRRFTQDQQASNSTYVAFAEVERRKIEMLTKASYNVLRACDITRRTKHE
jgi:hypothetical protein